MLTNIAVEAVAVYLQVREERMQLLLADEGLDCLFFQRLTEASRRHPVPTLLRSLA